MDVERWLQTLDPLVLTRWIVYAKEEPETFAAGSGDRQPAAHDSGPIMVDAKNAEAMFRRRYG